MSHTNSTPNYNLPQFVGTDKPTWLNDVNGAMSAIDTQMKANADGVTTADTKATTANNAIGTLGNLNTTTKTDVVSAVNEVNTALGVVSGVASSASSTATEALGKINTFEPLFNMTQFGLIGTNDITATRVNKGWGQLRYACNADGSICKLYGFLGVYTQNNASQAGYIEFDTPFRPTTEITINSMAVAMEVGTTVKTDSFISNFDTTISPNGRVKFEIGENWYNRKLNFYFPPCLYFMKDFGDTTPTPTPNA